MVKIYPFLTKSRPWYFCSIILTSLFLSCSTLLHAAIINEESKLHTAVASSNMGAIKTLLACSAKVNALDSQHNTPLHYACRIADPEIIETLLRYGANANAKNTDGLIPLDVILYHETLVNAKESTDDTKNKETQLLRSIELLLIHASTLVWCQSCECASTEWGLTGNQCPCSTQNKLLRNTSKKFCLTIQNLMNAAAVSDTINASRLLKIASFDPSILKTIIGRLLINKNNNLADAITKIYTSSDSPIPAIYETLIVNLLLDSPDHETSRYGFDLLKNIHPNSILPVTLDRILNKFSNDQLNRSSIIYKLDEAKKFPHNLFGLRHQNSSQELLNQGTINIVSNYENLYDPNIFRLFGLLYIKKLNSNVISAKHKAELNDYEKTNPKEFMHLELLAQTLMAAKASKFKKLFQVLTQGILLSGFSNTNSPSQANTIGIQFDATPPNEIMQHILHYSGYKISPKSLENEHVITPLEPSSKKQ